ncbi:MAG TPA: class I SAM-dependent methyltransferase [Candidatus Krumholzibacteria bacterium]|nr:class I SAM-dependent methyltransferase [Candidatus Krumholzibacteria bacterium]
MQATTQSSHPDYESIKVRQQAVWGSGDYGRIGVQLQIVGEELCEAVDLRSSERVLDVAAGNGNASLAAARRLAQVTSADYVPALLDQEKRRAEAEGLAVATRIADVENLPFVDGEFDVVLSTFGVMFAPDQERAAAEMVRVVRSGGRIGMANWTPGGFVGELFRIVGKMVPGPQGLASPSLWGTETRLVELFGRHALDIRTQRKQFLFREHSAASWVESFRRYYGPIHTAFAGLDRAGQIELESAMLSLLHAHNRGGHDSLLVPSEYLEVVIRRA